MKRFPPLSRALCCLSLLLILSGRPLPCAAVRLERYREDRYGDDAYQYVSFGRYPNEKDGTAAPLLWRVLGPGAPARGDVIDASNEPGRSWKKVASDDDLSGENADVYCLMTEYIIDFILYHDVRDEPGDGGLDYENTLMYRSLNGEVLSAMLTPEEQKVLVPMPERGLLALPCRRGELFRTDYGFPAEDFTESRTRRATGTPYAFSQGLRRISGPYSWYFTADWRRPGFRWIVGDNGHISVSGVNRRGGVRPIVYVHADRLKSEGGSGTKEDPLRLVPADIP